MSNVDVNAPVSDLLNPAAVVHNHVAAKEKAKLEEKEEEEEKVKKEEKDQHVIKDDLDKGQEVHLSPMAAKVLGKSR